MSDETGTTCYLARMPELRTLFDTHARAWRPFLAHDYGAAWAATIIEEARAHHEALIPALPDVGGDQNPLIRHLFRSTTSLALFKAMDAWCKRPDQVGKVIYDAVVESVRGMLPTPPLTPAELDERRAQAAWSQQRRYPGDWVWALVEGDGVSFDYGYDFFECATCKLYHAHGAGAFLPFYCYLDFVTERTPGWGFSRTTTLAEGGDRCAFRYQEGGQTQTGWPPPFLR